MARILIVDDEEDIRASLRLALENAELEVMEAESGLEADKLLKQYAFDLVITDIIMPDKEGIELIVDINKKYPNLKIIAITGGGNDVDQKLNLKAAAMLGVEDTLQKPFKPDTLLQSIEKCLSPHLIAGKKAPHAIVEKLLLYIEDDLPSAELMEMIVSQISGVRFITEKSGELGVVRAITEHPDLIFLDLQLPKMDGFEVLERLKENEATKDIPVIALTAYAMSSDINKGLKFGFKRYLTKPFYVNEVMTVIAKELGQNKEA